MPSEVVLLLHKELPLESRIALALTSHTMMFKSGGIAWSSNSILSDKATVPENQRGNRQNHDNGEDEEEEEEEK
jgi:hypothetical protein